MAVVVRSLGQLVDGRSLVVQLKECGNSRDIEKGRLLHAAALRSEVASTIYVANALISMYAKCGAMEEACSAFEAIKQPSLVSWNTLIFGYVANGKSEAAFEALASMQEFEADSRTFVAALKACSVDGKLSLQRGMALHRQGASNGCDENVFFVSALVDMYAKCTDVSAAYRVLDKSIARDQVCWNSLLSGYVENGLGTLALQRFAQIELDGCFPDGLTFVAAVNACSSLPAKGPEKLQQGMALHARIALEGYDTGVIVASALVDMYFRCSNRRAARRVFDSMTHPNVVSWNSLVLGYVANGEGRLALEMFSCALETSDAVTFIAALKACSFVPEVMAVQATCAWDSDILVSSTLVSTYAKFGCMSQARRAFDTMPRRDVIAWTALISGYVDNGDAGMALELFRLMCGSLKPDGLTFVAALRACSLLADLESGRQIHSAICKCGLQSDHIIATALVDLYGKCGMLPAAQQVFDELHPLKKDLVAWNALIAAYGAHGDYDRVLALLHEMKDNGRVTPDERTFLSVLSACSHAGLIHKGKEHFERMLESGVSPRLEHYHCMVDMLGRANDLVGAVQLVENMPFRAVPTTWRTLLAASRNVS